jgi:hypothetical protein
LQARPKGQKTESADPETNESGNSRRCKREGADWEFIVFAVAASSVALHLLAVGKRNNEQNQLMPSYGHECHRVVRMTIARKNPWGWARPVLTLV